MPGIVGLFSARPAAIAEAELLQMVAALRPEAADRTGTWVDESLGVYVGWSVRKGSFADDMPLKNEQESLVLAFAGEEFPAPGTARDLASRGHRLDPGCPSYLVHLAEENAGFPAGLNGRFHGLLVDRLRRTATLFNDRYGMHRLYYHAAKDTFYFAAAARAILAVCPALRRVDPRALGELVACGCVMEDRTLFPGIQVLPGGAAWVFRRGELERRRTYFQRTAWEDQPPLEPEVFYRELRATFAQTLSRYFDGPEPVGMSLTGGLDTRMIMAWHKPPPRSLPCYTFAGMFRDCHDARVARRVAEVSGQSHEVIRVGQDFLVHFPCYAERTVYLTDGCADVSHAPDLYANERAREIAPVRMTGNYGSEVLRQVVAFKPQAPRSGLFRPDLVTYIRQAEDTFRSLRRGNPLSFAVFRQAPWHHYGLLALEQTQLSLRSPYLDNELVRLAFRAPASALTGDNLSVRLIADGDPALAHIPTDRGVGGERGHLGAALSRGLYQLSRKAEYAYDYGMPHSLARIDRLAQALHLERLFLGRHKFYHFRVWYRDVLAGYVRDILLDPRTLARPYLERAAVEMVVRHHLKGDRNYTTEIHKLLTLELVHRLFVDGP